jgi:hypothetical protein
VPTVAAALKRLVAAMNVGEGQVLRWDYDWVNRDLFPDEIVAVRVAKLAALTKSHWSCPDAGLVPDVEPRQIQAVIDEKAGRLHDYRQECSAVWLVIVADGFSISTMHTVTRAAARHRYWSPFDRTLYFENFSRQAISLIAEHSV